MGCTGSKAITPEETTSKSIDATLVSDHNAVKAEIKLLLLGAGESGKTTIKKQMQMIDGAPLSDDERTQFADVCRTNMVSSLQIILDNMIGLGIPLESPGLREQANMILDLENDSGSIGLSSDGNIIPGVLEAVVALWADAGVRSCLARSYDYQLNDSAEYFLDNAARICAEEWVPNDMDVLRARVKTTGISETRFKKKNKQFVVVDVGGQRSERRKWLHCFDAVTALLYVVALNEYNMHLREDESMNRMQEALVLYSSIVTSPYFVNVPVIIFLNKADLLRAECLSGDPKQLIEHELYKPIFPDFAGNPAEWKVVFRYIEGLFTQAHRAPNIKDERIRRKKVYSHMCTATDRDNIAAVLASVADIVLRSHIETAGLL